MAEEKTKVLRVHVDTAKLTLGDLETLESLSSRNGNQQASMKQVNDLLSRAVTVEGLKSIRDLPVSELKNIITQLGEAIKQEASTSTDSPLGN